MYCAGGCSIVLEDVVLCWKIVYCAGKCSIVLEDVVLGWRM